LNELTEELLTESILEVITNPSYREKAKLVHTMVDKQPRI
jgi:UDP:flavonoid glycosyltransferase YjiC (YdhE family)